MTDFRCLPIETAVAERFRRTGRDDRGEAVHRRVATGHGFPCRHCLRQAAAGDAMLLASYDLPRPRGVYWTPSPIFLHADACPPFTETNVLAPILRDSVVSVRSYDAEELCLYDLGVVCDGAEVGAPLARALEDARTRFVNIHTARPGCLLCRVERG